MPYKARQVTYSKQALRALMRCPRNVSELIRAKINQYAADPASLVQNVKALKGEDGMLRLRVGDWRVIFSETLEIVDVIKIASRGDAYS
jgi:mRNA interferase RelE/StbE